MICNNVCIVGISLVGVVEKNRYNLVYIWLNNIVKC